MQTSDHMQTCDHMQTSDLMQRMENMYRITHNRYLQRYPWSMTDKREYRNLMRGRCTKEQRVLWWVTGIENGVFEKDEYFGADHDDVHKLFEERNS